MYISVKPVSFTDQELDRIWFAVSAMRDNLVEASPDEYCGSLVDFHKEELELLSGILTKIKTSGIFSGVGVSNEGG